MAPGKQFYMSHATPGAASGCCNNVALLGVEELLAAAGRRSIVMPTSWLAQGLRVVMDDLACQAALQAVHLGQQRLICSVVDLQGASRSGGGWLKLGLAP